MLALDTNVLVRFLVEDDAAQTARVRDFLARLAKDELCLVTDVVLCELVWVLRRSYRFSRDAIARVVRQLLYARQLTFASRDSVERALRDYEGGRGDFADYLIRDQARSLGCEAVVTLDRALLAEDDSTFIAP